MTINHIFLNVSPSTLPRLRTFYTAILKPLGYIEHIAQQNRLFGYGTDYPYFWLNACAQLETQKPVPTHIAIEAKDFEAVDRFYEAAIEAGATDNGKPGIRPEMSRQPYYSAFIKDEDGNNIEAVYVEK